VDAVTFHNATLVEEQVILLLICGNLASECAAHCDEPISRIIIPESECNSPPISVITDSNIHMS